MKMLFIFFVIIDVLLWGALITLRAVRLQSSAVSEYELRRRAADGDDSAQYSLRRDGLLADVRELKYLSETLLFVIVIVVTVGLIGPWWSILVMFIVLLQIEATVRAPLVVRTAGQLYAQYEPFILRAAEKARPVLRWFRTEADMASDQAFVYSKQELIDKLAETNVLSTRERTMLEHGLAFGDKRVIDVMTPGPVIEAVRETETLGPVVLNRLHKSGHSRFPVYAEDLDHVVGMLYMHNLVPLHKDVKLARDAMEPEVFYIREDHGLDAALAAFLRTHHHLFIVVNNYRETVGLLSLEDVVETLLGHKIIDEFDEYHDLRAVAEKNPRKNNLPAQRNDV